MSRRAVALVLVLLFGAHPLVGIVCAIDCDQPRKPASCHESVNDFDGPRISGARHACDRDHAAAIPAVIAGAGRRDSLHFLARLDAPILMDAAFGWRHPTSPSRHGPPGADGSSLAVRTSVLRI